MDKAEQCAGMQEVQKTAWTLAVWGQLPGLAALDLLDQQWARAPKPHNFGEEEGNELLHTILEHADVAETTLVLQIVDMITSQDREACMRRSVCDEVAAC